MKVKHVVVGLCLVVGGCVGVLDDTIDPAQEATGGNGGNGGNGARVPSSPGNAEVPREPLRRLTARELRNSIRDIFGIDEQVVRDATGALTEDGFAGVVRSNHALPALQAEVRAYHTAAQILAPRAVEALGCGEDACAHAELERVARSAFRRELTTEERTALFAVYDEGAKDSVGLGLQAAVTSILQSPFFIYRVEVPTAEGRVSDQELAARIAAFLWRSVPDDALLRAAETGELSTPDGVRAQARRMLSDPRAEETMVAFTLEWLGIFGNHHTPRIEDTVKSPDVFSEFDVPTEELVESLVRFVREVYAPDGEPNRFERLLTSPVVHMTPGMASYYGAAPGPVRFEGRRAGVLTHPAVMTLYGGFDQTDPINRGLFILEHLLCINLGAPPPETSDGEPIGALPGPSEGESRRQQLLAHASDPCATACHSMMDPLGLAFEHYDSTGAYREMDGRFVVDASGTVPLPNEDEDLVFTDAVELGQQLASHPRAQECAAQHWLEFAVSREVEHNEPELAELASFLRSSGGDLRALLVEIAASETLRRGPRMDEEVDR